MANEQVVSFLNDFSIEVTPNAAKKIDNFSDYLSPGTLIYIAHIEGCLLYTSPSPRDLSTSRMPSSA